MTQDKPMTVSDEQPSSDKLDAACVFLGPFLVDEGLEGQLLGRKSGAVYDAATKAITALQSKAEQQLKKLDGLWREKHATLQSERDRMLRERDTYKEARLVLAHAARAVMTMLEIDGPCVVPHLIDTDDNAGQRLRELIEQTLAAPQGGETK